METLALFPDVTKDVDLKGPDVELRFAERTAHIHDARTDANYFIAASGCILDEQGRPLPYSDYQGVYASTLQYCYSLPTKKHVAHMAPPGLGKSVLTRGFLCWAIGNNPALKTIVISAEVKLAARPVTRCRNVVGRGVYRVFFPDAIPDTSRERDKKNKIRDDEFKDEGGKMGWTMKDWFLVVPGSQSVDPTMSADAAIPTGEARRPDILVADDTMSRTICGSSVMMDEAIGAFHETWLNGRLSNNGWCVVNHNCWRSDDLLHRLRKDSRFVSLWIGVNDDNDRLFVRLWNPPPGLPVIRYPRRFHAVEVNPLDAADVEFEIPFPENRHEWEPAFVAARAKNDPESHRMLFQLKAQSVETVMFPNWPARRQPVAYPAQLIGCDETANHIPIMKPIDLMRWTVVGGLDWSGRKRRGKALTLMARDSETRVVIPIYHSRIKTDPNKPGRVQMVANELRMLWNLGIHWQLVNAEDNAIQGELNDSIRTLGFGEDWIHTIADYTTDGVKMDVRNGLPPIDVKIQMGGIVWPYGMAAVNPDWSVLESEMATIQRELNPGETPDGPMTIWFCIRALDRLGNSTDASEASAIPSEATTSMERMGF